MPWLFAGAGIVVAVFAIAFAVMLTGNSTPLGPAHHPHNQAVAALPSATLATPIQTPSPTRKPTPKSRTPKRTPSASPSPARGAAAPPPASPTPPPTSPPPPTQATPPASVQLAATVTVNSGWQSQSSGLAVFEVTDTGSAATGQVTATITLPAGASMMAGDGGGGDGGHGALDWGSHWNCQPTSTGATCQHAGIGAGAQAGGAIFFTLSGTSACGQPVQIEVASGSASASAQSADGIAC